MKIENPVAFQFILQDDIYLLNNDKAMYGNSTLPKPTTDRAVVHFNHLGGNKKNFLIVVHYPGTAFMDDKHLAALENTNKR